MEGKSVAQVAKLQRMPLLQNLQKISKICLKCPSEIFQKHIHRKEIRLHYYTQADLERTNNRHFMEPSGCCLKNVNYKRECLCVSQKMNCGGVCQLREVCAGRKIPLRGTSSDC